MEYITSRGYVIPKEASEFETELRFHLWQKKLWPYEELVPGDLLYWYETKCRSIVWKSRVVDVDRFPYSNKSEVIEKLKIRFHSFDEKQDYFVNKPDQGYCLALKVKAIERIDLPKPHDLKFPRLGWMKINGDIAKRWLNHSEQINDVILDDLAPSGSLIERIHYLNALMKHVSPARVSSIISYTIRKDSQIVKALKSSCEFKCQFPGCNVQISKREGGFYIEVAHIKPISRGGRSVIGNLLVLCPNHHKEFDYGNLEIIEQTEALIRGKLNGKDFQILFPGMSYSVQ